MIMRLLLLASGISVLSADSPEVRLKISNEFIAIETKGGEELLRYWLQKTVGRKLPEERA